MKAGAGGDAVIEALWQARRNEAMLIFHRVASRSHVTMTRRCIHDRVPDAPKPSSHQFVHGHVTLPFYSILLLLLRKT